MFTVQSWTPDFTFHIKFCWFKSISISLASYQILSASFQNAFENSVPWILKFIYSDPL